MEQKYTSEKTSLNQIAATYKHYDLKGTVLDIGCGRYYERTKEYMDNKNVKAFGYDPYNQTAEDNDETLNAFTTEKPNNIVCCNVLNVIAEDEIVEGVVQMISDYADVDTNVIIQIYDGDKSGIGKPTACGYQRNAKANEYLPIINKYFDTKIRENKFIECRKRG